MNNISIFIDTETGGTEKEHALLQLAGIVVEETGSILEVKEEFNFFIQPFPDDKVEDSALSVNHISREQLSTFLTPREGYYKFNSILSKYCDKYNKLDKMFFVGYNSPFDSGFVRRFFEKNGDNYYGSWFWTPDIDVMRQAAWLLKDQRHLLPNFKQETVAKYLGIEIEGDLHDALTDIKVTMKIYQKLNNK